MKQVRDVDCACGHKIRAEVEDWSSSKLGEVLFTLVQQHVDQVHPTLNLSNRDIWIMLAEKAYTPTDTK